MRTPLVKDIFRDIKKSFGRFMSIFAIVALGVAFFSGIKMAPIDMKYTSDEYYDEYNLMDLRILSTLGLTDKDVKALKEVEGVNGVFPTYSMDAITKYNSKEVVLKIHSIPLELFSSSNENYINRMNLVEGRYPQKENECLIEKGRLGSNDIKIGDKIKLDTGTDKDIKDTLNVTEYTVVGMAETPYYLSFEKGTTSIGSGEINGFLVIPQENFKSEIYTDIYLTIDNAKELNSYKEEYFEIVDPTTTKVEEIGKDRVVERYNEIYEEAKEELEKGKKEVEKKEKEVKDELKIAEEEIKKAEEDLNFGEMELIKNENNLKEGIWEAKKELDSKEEVVKNAEEKYNQGLSQFNIEKEKNNKEFEKAEEEIILGEKALESLLKNKGELEIILGNPDITEEESKVTEGLLNELNKNIANLEKTLEDGKRELENGKKALVKAEAQLVKKGEELKGGKEAIAIGKSELESEEKKNLALIESGKKEIENGKAELEVAKKELENGKKEASEEFDLAKSKLKDSEESLNDLEKGEWYVLDRNSHYSYVDYGNNADSIDALAKIFPVFFFLVAALVCLTTMTRMVDEQRVNIGTMKALGYSKGAIASKYIVYALFASLGGSILGVIIGVTIFPIIVYNAYAIMYVLPPVQLRIDLGVTLGITIVAVLVTTMAALSACYKELVETPSVLMRPKAPKEGKRILLERIPFIWSKFTFIGKVTVRNIFRYKKRFFMTVIGIAGCTALLITGFGVKDSIETIVDRQFNYIYKYGMSINLNSNATISEKNKIVKEINSNENVIDSQKIRTENCKIKSESTEKEAMLFVSESGEEFSKFITLENRKTKEKNHLGKGIILTEKIAKILNVEVGDSITITNDNDKKAEVLITGITENYIAHYGYITADYYKEVFKSEVEYNNVISLINDLDNEGEEKLSSEINKYKEVTGVKFNSTIKNSFGDTIKSLNYVVLVMIISAGGLAFVVLYNLTNVNISERMREIATIKVLGFYDNEVSAYIYRENIILTVVGTVSGLGLGVILHRFIMITVEIESLMFGRNIDFGSFIMATLLTVLFSVLVNLAMYYKLKKVKMVESLKSVD